MSFALLKSKLVCVYFLILFLFNYFFLAHGFKAKIIYKQIKAISKEASNSGNLAVESDKADVAMDEEVFLSK